MGESREGEGRSRKATTADIMRYIVDTYPDETTRPDRILIRQATPKLYACQITWRGDKEPEAFFLWLDGGPDVEGLEPEEE